MKNHFFIPYAGNKREEVEHIYNLLDLENIDTIVEPFCGSCAISYYIWSKNKDKNYKYILNDLDSNLIDLLILIKDGNYKDLENDINNKRIEIIEYENDKDKAKKIYGDYVKQKNLNGYLLSNKYYTIRSGLFPLKDFTKFNNKLDLSSCPMYDFLKNANIELYNKDGNEIIDENNNNNTFIFLDPPYIASCNNFYKKDNNVNICNIYEKLTLYGLKNFKCKIMICHENNWLFKIIFKEYIKDGDEYEKLYQTKKKKTFHICIKNY